MGKTADTSFALSRKDVGILDGFRNKIINGNFDIWQRGVTQTSNGYGSDDRWRNANAGSTKTHSRQSFTIGQTDVTGNPTYFSRTVVTSVAGVNNLCFKYQTIQNVYTLSGRKATVTFYAKADGNKNIAVEMTQEFGTGGSPSNGVTGIGSQLVALTTSWKRYDIIIDMPSISGKTLGTNNNHCLQLLFWFDAGTSFAARTSNLGQQSGTFDIARVSLVEGDARLEADPFSERHYSQESALCNYFYQTVQGNARFTATGSGQFLNTSLTWTPMRVQPTASFIGQLLGTNLQNGGVGSLSPTGGSGGRFEIVSVNTGDCYSFGCYFGLDAEI